MWRRLCDGKAESMDLRLRWKLKALPIWNPEEFPLRSAITALITISEQSATAAGALEAALDKLSDAELNEYSHPGEIPSTSEAIAFCANKSAQSSQYQWRQQDNCLVLLSRSKLAESRNMPGVAFEFIIRTGISSWAVYRVPDPGEILDCAMYFERNELISHSQRPSKLPVLVERERLRFRLAGIRKAIGAALLPLPARKDSSDQREKSDEVAVSGGLP